ncbi:MAG: hypothetical protein QNI84_03145 [Henriciella sp.]|nr:hypothetical protein [Henriciella sp.]
MRQTLRWLALCVGLCVPTALAQDTPAASPTCPRFTYELIEALSLKAFTAIDAETPDPETLQQVYAEATDLQTACPSETDVNLRLPAIFWGLSKFSSSDQEDVMLASQAYRSYQAYFENKRLAEPVEDDPSHIANLLRAQTVEDIEANLLPVMQSFIAPSLIQLEHAGFEHPAYTLPDGVACPYGALEVYSTFEGGAYVALLLDVLQSNADPAYVFLTPPGTNRLSALRKACPEQSGDLTLSMAQLYFLTATYTSFYPDKPLKNGEPQPGNAARSIAETALTLLDEVDANPAATSEDLANASTALRADLGALMAKLDDEAAFSNPAE